MLAPLSPPGALAARVPLDGTLAHYRGSVTFSLDGLRRWPDVEAPDLGAGLVGLEQEPQLGLLRGRRRLGRVVARLGVELVDGPDGLWS